MNVKAQQMEMHMRVMYLVLLFARHEMFVFSAVYGNRHEQSVCVPHDAFLRTSSDASTPRIISMSFCLSSPVIISRSSTGSTLSSTCTMSCTHIEKSHKRVYKSAYSSTQVSARFLHGVMMTTQRSTSTSTNTFC